MLDLRPLAHPLEAAYAIRQLIGQDPPQPGAEVGIGLAAKLRLFFVCLEKSLLHQVGWIKLAAQVRAQLETGNQMQILAITLQWAR